MTIYTEDLTSRRSIFASIITDKLNWQINHWFRIQTIKHNLRQERRQLLTMTDEMLKDMGISHAEAEAEARRKDIPANRLGLLSS